MMRPSYLILMLYILLVSAVAVPNAAAQPLELPDLKETPALELDEALVSYLAEKAVDPGNVVLYRDYGEIKSNMAVYRNTANPTEYYAVISQTPMTDPDGTKLDPHWELVNGVWAARGETFQAHITDNGQTTITLPYGNYSEMIRAGSQLVFAPAVYLNDQLQTPSKPYVPAADMFGNPNYSYNCLVWDYGFAQRVVRLIEGQFQGRWLFYQPPKADVVIKYNQHGDFPLQLGHYAVDDDTEVVTPADIELELLLYGAPAIVSDTLTVYPDANPETTTVDGNAAHYFATGDGWNPIHDGTGTQFNDTSTTSYCGFNRATGLDKWTLIFRSFFLYDTSGLPDDCTVTGATFSLYGNSKIFEHPQVLSSYNVYASNPASNTGLAASDYNHVNWGTTALCDTALAEGDLTTAGYNDWALNASGLALISKTGITKLGLRWTNDASDTDPSITSASADYFLMYTAEQGAGFQPKLVITYTPAGAAAVTTGCPTGITSASAVLHGEITDLGGVDVTRRGFLYGTSGTPTFADNDTYETSAAFSTGTYSLSVSGLTDSALYYVRAYAVNSAGTGYGSVTPFATDLLPQPSDASDHPYYTRVTVYNDSAGTVTDRIQATLNAGSLVDSYYCQADGSDLVSTQSSSGIPLTATEMDGSASTWLLPRETLTAGEELIDLIWMGAESGTRNQLWIADADDTVYAADDATLDAVDTVSITAYVSPSGTPSAEVPVVSKPGNYKLALTGSLNYEFTVYQGHGAPVSAGTKTVAANGDTTGLEGVTGASSHWEAVSTANDSTYVWDSRPTTGHYDLFTLTPAIPDGSVITSVTVWYRAKISGDCVGDPSARVMPVMSSQATGVISGSPVYTTGGVFATGSHTFAAYPLSSDLQIGIDLHSDSNCSESTRCSRLWANVDYTPPGSSETVSISATLDTTEAIRASYNGSTLAIENLSNCDTDTLAVSGTLCVSADLLYVAMFDGNIDEVQGTVDGSDAFSYSFEPDEISATLIEDQSGQNNDLTYSLSGMNGNITVSVAGITTYELTYYGGGLVSSGSPSQIPVYLPDEPDNLTGDEHGYDRFPGAGFVNDMLADAEIPRSAFWLSFFFALIIGLGFVAFRATRDILSIILACISILVIQSVTRMGIGYLDIVMLLVCFAALYFRREYSRGQLS